MSTSSLPPALADRIGFLVARTHWVFHERAQAVLAETGERLGIKHFGALSVIVDEGPLSQQLLGDRMMVDRTTMVNLIDDLERAGMVTRDRNPADRRAYALEATAAGRRWCQEAGVKLVAAQDEILAPLDDRERKQLLTLLQALLVGQPAELVADPPVEVRPG
jgi:DNA-binding MarR family transcriptional regulator